MTETQHQQNGGEVEARRIAPLQPETRGDLLAQYRLKKKRTINDLVEDIVVRLWEDDEFQKLVGAIYDEEAVSGNMGDDDVLAAIQIKTFAEKNGHAEVASKNIHTIKLAMRVALRRFNEGRGDRFERAELPAPGPTPAPQPAE